jgi:hypothetical protein
MISAVAGGPAHRRLTPLQFHIYNARYAELIRFSLYVQKKWRIKASLRKTMSGFTSTIILLQLCYFKESICMIDWRRH